MLTGVIERVAFAKVPFSVVLRRVALAINVTIKNMPPKLYEKLKVRAAAHRRSMNSEVIGCLEEFLIRQRESTEELLKKLEELRNRVSDAPPLSLLALSWLASWGSGASSPYSTFGAQWDPLSS